MIKKVIFFISLLLLNNQVFAQQNQNDQKFQGFNLEGFNDNGDKAWEVNGETADIMGEDIKLSNVDANSYGEKHVNLTAETGVINQTSGTMLLEKDVIITSEDGAQLITDSLDWNREADLVHTDDPVWITDQKINVSGVGMEAHPGLKNARIHENVRVTADVQDKENNTSKVTITSDGPMMIDQSLGLATFKDNVVAISDGRTLIADEMEVHFNQDMEGIEELICTGNVEIIQGENKTYAQKATYDAISKRLVLSGRPKMIMITEGDDAITALRD
ncbi:MAG: LPS export ABC transporter periplasmic protein LptC [Candidatus Omnitrophica bacterium]|nr:LPS export ABC transporter periplasmic protein LptC [Candidatus Omnitrophota bacterium]MCB9746868.1 LPS export ABC transporter periplasmic protein LptC [Candidatus Omnitrophota bacterium]